MILILDMSTCVVIKGGESLRKSVSSLALAFLLIFISSEIVNQNIQITELKNEHRNPVAQYPVESEVRNSVKCPEVDNKPCHCPTSNSTSSIVKHVKSLAHHRQSYISQVL